MTLSQILNETNPKWIKTVENGYTQYRFNQYMITKFSNRYEIYKMNIGKLGSKSLGSTKTLKKAKEKVFNIVNNIQPNIMQALGY